MKIAVPARSAGFGYFPACGATIRDEGTGSTPVGRPMHWMSRELALVAGRPCDPPGWRMISTLPGPAAVGPCPLHMRAVPVRDDRFQTSTIGGAHIDPAHPQTRTPREPREPRFGFVC